jgi:hypothetical protein
MFNTPASDASSVVAAARGVDDVLRVPPEPASCLKFGLSLLPLLSAIVTCLACKTREILQEVGHLNRSLLFTHLSQNASLNRNINHWQIGIYQPLYTLVGVRIMRPYL